MLSDKTNTYNSKDKENVCQPGAKRVVQSADYCQSLDIQYINQTYEKTKSIGNLTEDLERSFDMESRMEPSKMESNCEVQKSLCMQESEIQRLSQAYADKYYYEMKFEQYQNLLAQQQGTISKLLNEKRDLQQQLGDHDRDLNNRIPTEQIQNLELQVHELRTQNDYFQRKYEDQLTLNNTIQEEYFTYQKTSQQREEQLLQQIQEKCAQVSSLQNNQKSSKGVYEELLKQMNEIKEQNNYLFQQLSAKEQQIESNFNEQLQEVEDRANQEKQELAEDYDGQLQMKEEMIHQLELQVTDMNNQLQQLYSENLQLQNQLDLLNNNYQEDIEKQATLLQQQVGEYKVVINNLENQLFLMNAEIQRRGRSTSKEQNRINTINKFTYKRPDFQRK